MRKIRFFIPILLVLMLIMIDGCASINPEINKFDLENYEINKQLAKNQLTTWSFNSGFISGLGLTNKITFPIKSGEELRAIINSPTAMLALNDIDEICKKLGYWKDEDFDLGFSLGAKVRAGSQVAIQFVKDFFPQLMKYAPLLFGI